MLADSSHLVSSFNQNYYTNINKRSRCCIVFSAKAPLYDMQGHEEKILAVDWSVPQYMLSGGADNSLKIFKYTDKSVEGMH